MHECQPSGSLPSDISVSQARQLAHYVRERARREEAEHPLDTRGFKKPSYVSLEMLQNEAP